MNRTAVIAVAVFIALSVVGLVSTGASIFGVTGAGRTDQALGVNDVKPSACGGITVTQRIVGSGTISGGRANEILIGKTLADSISGGNGDDCLVGGAGNDSLNGGPGTDVCLGGPGTDTFHNSCETRIQ